MYTQKSLASHVGYYWRAVAAWISSETENTPKKTIQHWSPRCLGLNRALSALLSTLEVNSSRMSLCHSHTEHSVDVLMCCCPTPWALLADRSSGHPGWSAGMAVGCSTTNTDRPWLRPSILLAVNLISSWEFPLRSSLNALAWASLPRVGSLQAMSSPCGGK